MWGLKWLSLLHRLEEGAEQFRLDVAQNPNDTEESIWCFLCEAQLYGVNEARKRFLEVSLSIVKEEKSSLILLKRKHISLFTKIKELLELGTLHMLILMT